MNRILIAPIAAAILLSACLLFPVGTIAQKGVGKRPSLSEQLSQPYGNDYVLPESPLAELIVGNQEFSMLRSDEFNDKRGLPPWLRVWWRKAHPEDQFDSDDPTKGYPHVLKEVLEWMMSHQDLKAGPGMDEETGKANSEFVESLISTNVRVSGAQAAARSESYIQINYFNPLQILVASNNIAASGLQGVYRSLDGGVNWSQTTLPLAVGDSFHSDPTVDFTSDGRFYSSTLGINSGSTVLKLRNYVSADNGAIWTLEGTPSGTQTSVDKQIIWVDKSVSSPYFGQMYAIWHNNNPAYMNRRTVGAAGTWLATPTQVSGAETTGTAIGGDVKTNSTGTVFGFWPATGNSKIFVVKSIDGGATFGVPVQIAVTKDTYDIGVPAFSGRRALVYVSGGAYKSVAKDNVYVTWTDLSGDAGCTAPANEPATNVASTCKTRIWFSRSTNGGTTWSVPTRINNQAGLNDQFNPWLAVDETTGNVGIMYYDTVGDAGRKKTDVWFQSSFDDGATWGLGQKVTSSMTDETIAGANTGNQYGDYNGMSAYANSFFPSWTDRRNAAKEEIWTAPISIGPPAALLGSTGVTYISESALPANSSPDPGETVTVSLGLQNLGNADSSSVTASLDATGGVINPSSMQNYGVLAQGGGTATRNFTFTVNPAAICGSVINLTFQVQNGGGSSIPIVQTYTLGTPSTAFFENFDAVTPPAFPAGWTVTQDTGTGVNWASSGLNSSSPPRSANASDPPSIGMATLESPIISVTSSSAQFKFKNNYNTEAGSGTTGYDGMVLEIKIGTAAYSDILTAGGAFVSNGYNTTLSTCCSSPLAGRQAWAGSSGGFLDTLINLPASANGQSVQFRWRMASDSTIGSTGVYIDDVQLLQGSICSAVPFSVKSRADFDGDGRTDISVFRPSDGIWYQNRSTNGFSAVNWGVASDVIVPGDYDGDGKADVAVWRSSNTPGVSGFYVLNSNGSTFSGLAWGQAGDVPIPGDYDGDGKADFAVYRPSGGNWFVNVSATQSVVVATFGAAGDIPLSMDQDGDGKTNFAVYRPSNNTWYVARATGIPAQNFDTVKWGTVGDVLVPADYDGDSKDDVAVFRPSNGTWYIVRSIDSGFTFQPFGTNGDIAVPGDYDGDGKDDVAVYRNGAWYINGSTSGFTSQAFGVATDRPVPAAYRP